MNAPKEMKRLYDQRRWDSRNTGAAERRAERQRLNAEIQRIDALRTTPSPSQADAPAPVAPPGIPAAPSPASHPTAITTPAAYEQAPIQNFGHSAYVPTELFYMYDPYAISVMGPAVQPAQLGPFCIVEPTETWAWRDGDQAPENDDHRSECFTTADRATPCGIDLLLHAAQSNNECPLTANQGSENEMLDASREGQEYTSSDDGGGHEENHNLCESYEEREYIPEVAPTEVLATHPNGKDKREQASAPDATSPGSNFWREDDSDDFGDSDPLTITQGVDGPTRHTVECEDAAGPPRPRVCVRITPVQKRAVDALDCDAAHTPPDMVVEAGAAAPSDDTNSPDTAIDKADSDDNRWTAEQRRNVICTIVRKKVLPQLGGRSLRLKDTVAVHVIGIRQLLKRVVCVKFPDGQTCAPRKWTAAVMYVIMGLSVVERMRNAYNFVNNAMKARQGKRKTAECKGSRPANMVFTWYDVTSLLGLALRNACSRDPSRQAMAGIPNLVWKMGAKSFLAPGHWVQFLAKESHGMFVTLANLMPCQCSQALDKHALLNLAKKANIGGPLHVTSFALVLAAIDNSTGGWELLSQTSKARAKKLGVMKPSDVGVKTYGELSVVMCNLGELKKKDLCKLAKMTAQPPSLKPTHVDAKASDRVLRNTITPYTFTTDAFPWRRAHRCCSDVPCQTETLACCAWRRRRPCPLCRGSRKTACACAPRLTLPSGSRTPTTSWRKCRSCTSSNRSWPKCPSARRRTRARRSGPCASTR